jgi:hypothetical protein
MAMDRPIEVGQVPLARLRDRRSAAWWRAMPAVVLACGGLSCQPHAPGPDTEPDPSSAGALAEAERTDPDESVRAAAREAVG